MGAPDQISLGYPRGGFVSRGTGRRVIGVSRGCLDPPPATAGRFQKQGSDGFGRSTLADLLKHFGDSRILQAVAARLAWSAGGRGGRLGVKHSLWGGSEVDLVLGDGQVTPGQYGRGIAETPAMPRSFSAALHRKFGSKVGTRLPASQRASSRICWWSRRGSSWFDRAESAGEWSIAEGSGSRDHYRFT